MRMWRDRFEDFSFHVAEYVEIGDALVMPGWINVHARGSTAEVREPYTWLARMRNGKVVVVREYRTKDEALEALGLAGGKIARVESCAARGEALEAMGVGE
jgi:ketosteroid isomerase-like protein